MKRRILISMAVMLLSLPMCGNLWAESSGSCGDNITWTLDDDDNLTLTGSGQMADYNETYEHPWSDNVKTVTFAGDITGIGSSAFRGCSSLESIEIPSSVTSIGEYAFSGCSSLKKVYITDLSAWCRITFNSLSANPLCNGGALYLNGKEVKDLVIPDDVTKIGQRAFSGCSSLSSVTIPNSVTSIGDSAFSDCSSLTSIEIPNSVASIGEFAFYNCSRLSSVSIGNSVTSIGDAAFYNCSGLESVTIGNSVASIGSSAFRGCSSLTSLDIPNSVTSIGRYAFSDCSSLTSVTIGNSVASIGDAAFRYCNSLKIITVNATTPPDCTDYIFEGVDYSSCVLVVPDESISAYKNKSPWNQFLNISEVESVINDDEVSVKIENGNIVVNGTTDDVNMEVYNISGSRIYSGIVKSVQVPTAGLYLVKVLDKSYKIMVR